MLTLYAQASNTCITSQTYHKWSGDVILGYSGRYCSVYNYRIEHGLIKTSQISSVSYFNLVSWSFVWGPKPTKDPPWRRVWISDPCDSVPHNWGVEGGWYGSGWPLSGNTLPTPVPGYCQRTHFCDCCRNMGPFL